MNTDQERTDLLIFDVCRCFDFLLLKKVFENFLPQIKLKHLEFAFVYYSFVYKSYAVNKLINTEIDFKRFLAHFGRTPGE